MAQIIPLMSAPVRVGSGTTTQELRLASNVMQFDTLDLLLNIYEGTDVAVKIVTGMQVESDEGWEDLGSFTSTLDAPSSEKRTMSNPLAFIRWEVTLSSGNATFMLSGIARQT